MAPHVTDVRNRLATPNDLPSIVSVWAESMEVHAKLDPRFPLSSDAPETFTGYLREALADGDSFLFVAESNGRIVAYCLARIAEYPPVFTKRVYGYINDLMVAASHRRQGVGTSLFVSTAGAIRARGVDVLEVSFVPHNPMASSFWRKLGFKSRLETLRLDSGAT
jgi:ribosomal protein S18 acetylase RimI-like enzyme